MRESVKRAESRRRISETIKLVDRLGKMAALSPEKALQEAHQVEDPSMRASGLIAIGKN